MFFFVFNNFNNAFFYYSVLTRFMPHLFAGRGRVCPACTKRHTRFPLKMGQVCLGIFHLQIGVVTIAVVVHSGRFLAPFYAGMNSLIQDYTERRPPLSRDFADVQNLFTFFSPYGNSELKSDVFFVHFHFCFFSFPGVAPPPCIWYTEKKPLLKTTLPGG